MKKHVENRQNYSRAIRGSILGIGVVLFGALFIAGCSPSPVHGLEPNETKGLNPDTLCAFSGENIKADGYVDYVQTTSYTMPDTVIDCGNDCSVTIPGVTFYTTHFNLYFDEKARDNVVDLDASGEHRNDFLPFTHVEITGTVTNYLFNENKCYISSALISPYKEKVPLSVEP